MNKLIFSIIVALFVVFSLLMLQFILPTPSMTKYTDNELRQVALSKGMSSVPNSFEGLLKVVNNQENLLTVEKIALGKKLYFDPILSRNKDISCATCHILDKDNNNTLLSILLSKNINMTDCVACHISDKSGVDRLSSAVGHNELENKFHLNTPTILNSSLSKFLTWDGSVKSVEEQAGLSIMSSFKMDMTPKELEQRLKNNSEYITKFKAVFNKDITFENVQKAIGAYVRTLLTRGDYDRFLDGNNSAISDEAKRGLANFINFGCKGCHSGMGVGGQSIQKFPLRRFARIHDIRPNLELYPELKILNNRFPFENKGNFLGKDGNQKFRVPNLRNVTKTSPYFHNGAVDKIREAVDIMAKHQTGRNLSDTQIDELVEFLKTLEGDMVDYSNSKDLL